MRIIAGEKKGHRLLAPTGRATRPTLERVRASLFMMLDPWLEGARTLDLFAGAGTLGLEALSRGASEAVLIERSERAVKALRANVARLNWGRRARVVKAEVGRYLGGANERAGQPFDLIFLDPPYGEGLAHQTMERLGAQAEAWVSAGGWVIAQACRRDAMAEAYGVLEQAREKVYGDTKVVFYHRDGEASDGG